MAQRTMCALLCSCRSMAHSTVARERRARSLERRNHVIRIHARSIARSQVGAHGQSVTRPRRFIVASVSAIARRKSSYFPNMVASLVQKGLRKPRHVTTRAIVSVVATVQCVVGTHRVVAYHMTDSQLLAKLSGKHSASMASRWKSTPAPAVLK